MGKVAERLEASRVDSERPLVVWEEGGWRARWRALRRVERATDGWRDRTSASRQRNVGEYGQVGAVAERRRRVGAVVDVGNVREGRVLRVLGMPDADGHVALIPLTLRRVSALTLDVAWAKIGGHIMGHGTECPRRLWPERVRAGKSPRWERDRPRLL